VKGVLENQSQVVTRRHAVIAAVYGLWAIIAAALGLPALVYLFFPPKARKQDEWVDAGDISKFTPNSPVEVTFRRNRVDGWKVISEKSTAWVVKMASGPIVAFGPQCTHLGCAYHWEETKSQFLCPCHASLFAVDGKVVSGPAPRPLDRYQTKIQGNKLELGKLENSKESVG
jgi:menaquinol-cytochrome c reductase iron-sulfur subunit